MIANENNATEQNSMSANENNVTEPNNMNDNENNTTEQNNDSKIEQSKSIRKILKFLGALVTVGTVVYGVTHFIDSVNNNYAVIYKDNENIKTTLEELKDKDNELQVELNKISTSINTLNTSVTLLNQAVNPQVVSGSLNIIKEMYTILNAPSGAIRQESLELGTIIGKNIEGNDVTAEDIIDEPIIISYYEDGQEIYFYGLLNEKLNWDGYCIFNVYKNDALISINESLFLNGQRENYKTLSRINDEVWLYNERECYDDVNIGNTIKYSMKYEKNRDFDTSDVKYSDIVYINSVVNVLAPKVLQYYSGNTTNEKYNDDSGKAYLIDYFEDGTVKTIYQGCFENGLFNDTSGNAWYITKDTNTNYMYYEGPFVNGEASDKSGRNFKSDLTMKEINEYIASLNIEKTLIFDAD